MNTLLVTTLSSAVIGHLFSPVIFFSFRSERTIYEHLLSIEQLLISPVNRTQVPNNTRSFKINLSGVIFSTFSVQIREEIIITWKELYFVQNHYIARRNSLTMSRLSELNLGVTTSTRDTEKKKKKRKKGFPVRLGSSLYYYDSDQ